MRGSKKIDEIKKLGTRFRSTKERGDDYVYLGMCGGRTLTEEKKNGKGILQEKISSSWRHGPSLLVTLTSSGQHGGGGGGTPVNEGESGP